VAHIRWLVVALATVATATPLLAQPRLPPVATETQAVEPEHDDPSGLAGSAVEPTPGLDTHARQPLFAPIGHDFRSLFSSESVRTVGLLAVGALAVSPFDGASDPANSSGTSSAFTAGRIGGNFVVQGGLAAGTYLIGRATGSDRVSDLGGDLLRAQLLSQAVVQAGQFATHRQRPDGSNYHSLPSGHTASAFATASVLQGHFGWRIGVPAYVFAGYVGASRIADNKHHLSDVVLGAGLGLLSARIVTMPIGGHKFGLSVTPAAGGAAFTFSSK